MTADNETNLNHLIQDVRERLARIECIMGRTRLQSMPLEMENVIAHVGKAFGFTAAQILARSHWKMLSECRHACIWIIRTLFREYSLEDTGRFLNNRQHSTISHACKVARNLMEQDAEFKSMVEKLLEECRKIIVANRTQ